MSVAIPLNDYFIGAPWYRRHEGAAYHIKDPHDPLAAGLWFATAPERMEIAVQVGYEYDGSSRETARRDYTFHAVDVQPGDAVIDYFLSFAETRTNLTADYDCADFYPRLHRLGALIRHHVPRDEFSARYELDDGRKNYREKSFQIRFAPEDAFLLMPDNSIEQVTQYSDVFRRGEKVSIKAPSLFSGSCARMICGQPLEFYLTEAREAHGGTPTLMDHLLEMPSSTGLSFSTHTDRNGTQHVPNPYATMRGLWQVAQQKLTAPDVDLSDEQRAEFRSHFDDIERRYTYFQQHPPRLDFLQP